MHSFIVASINTQSLKLIAKRKRFGKCREISTYIIGNGMIRHGSWLSAHGDEAKTVELALSRLDAK